MTFEWYEPKNRSNQNKHGVAFESAQNAFKDPYRLVFSDEKHSDREK